MFAKLIPAAAPKTAFTTNHACFSQDLNTITSVC